MPAGHSLVTLGARPLGVGSGWRSTCGRAGYQDPHRLSATDDAHGSWDGHGELVLGVLERTDRRRRRGSPVFLRRPDVWVLSNLHIYR